MNTVLKSSAALTRYELPREGISLLGYVVRRMHKTSWLLPVAELLAAGETAQALTQIGGYAAAAFTSFGPAYYQPTFNRVGERVSEADPATGIVVTAWRNPDAPHLRLSYSAELPDGSRFEGEEEITGTTVSLSGLGMPAPTRATFRAAGGYSATLVGTLVSELLPRWPLAARIRAHGQLDLRDTDGNRGALEVKRSGETRITVSAGDGTLAVQRVLHHLGAAPAEN